MSSLLAVLNIYSTSVDEHEVVDYFLLFQDNQGRYSILLLNDECQDRRPVEVKEMLLSGESQKKRELCLVPV